jgi:Protein of unknown function (DUF3048) N-terminal domain
MAHEQGIDMSRSGPNKVATKGIRVIAVVGAAVLATMLGACSSDKPKAVPITTTTATTQAVVPNPLTGIVPSPSGPVIAVKVDDTAPGRPSLGVDRADVIYIEEVEGGLTRMLAVFASARPDVRAVRSIRSSDPELLGQYGKIIVVASGGGRPALRILDASTLHAVINDRGQVGFRRDPSRPAPYNLVSNLTKVSAAVKGDGVRDVGFTGGQSCHEGEHPGGVHPGDLRLGPEEGPLRAHCQRTADRDGQRGSGRQAERARAVLQDRARPQ